MLRKPRYALKIKWIGRPWRAALHEATLHPSVESANQAAEASVQFHDQLAALTPPEAVVSLHQRLLSLVQRLATDYRDGATALENQDPAAVKSVGQTLKKNGAELSDLGKEFKAAGVNL